MPQSPWGFFQFSISVMLNSSFLSHPTCDTFPSQLPLPPAALGQVRAPKIAALPRVLSCFQLLWESQGSCRDVMGWKEAKHQLGRDDFLFKWFYGNRIAKSYYTALFLFLNSQPEKRGCPQKGTQCWMWWHPVAQPALPWLLLGLTFAGQQLLTRRLAGSSGALAQEGELELCPGRRERERAEPWITGTQKLQILIRETGNSDAFFSKSHSPLAFFLLKRPHRDLLASVFPAVTFRPINSV